jgi:DNA mismatch endonuclease, patch repair protein
MARHVVSDARRRNMSAIRGKHTQPELLVRRYLHAAGLRYRLHDPALPGKPDIVLRSLRTVVQVHGCFWHHHGCSNSVWPKTRPGFWRKKILGNRTRDLANDQSLVRLGFKVVTVWECEAKDPKELARLVRPVIRRHRRLQTKASL